MQKIVGGFSIGKNINKRFLLRKCSVCNKEKYVLLSNTKRYNYTGICRKCQMTSGQTGENHHNWKGGKHIDYQGYVRIKAKGHPFADHRGYAKEHRLIAAEKWGVFAVMDNIVHHIDGNKLNNNIDNLELMSQGEHMTRHKELRQSDECSI